jgi:hypothetical protein
MQACSRDAKGGPSGAKSVQQSVIIIREIKPEYPQAYIKAMRELQERCITARAEVSNLQGKTYDGANDRWSDNDILILSAGRIEEYFDSSKYAVYKTISQPDLTKMDAASPDLSCRAPIKMIKTEILVKHFLLITPARNATKLTYPYPANELNLQSKFNK